MKKLLALSALLLSLHGYGADFIPGCRVKADTLKRYGSLSGNASCVITRKEHGTFQFLLVYSGHSKKIGWAFPGGKGLSKSFDSNLDPKTGKPFSQESFEGAQRISFDYAEPAVCTAGRETREETGADVVVGERLAQNVQVTAFRCHPLFPDQLKEPIQTHDPAEIDQVGWFSLEQMRAPGFLRFPTDLPIAESELGHP